MADCSPARYHVNRLVGGTPRSARGALGPPPEQRYQHLASPSRPTGASAADQGIRPGIRPTMFLTAPQRRAPGLERHPRAELDVARVVGLGGDGAEARAGRGQVRSAEQRLVAQVERLRADLQLDALLDNERLGQ